MDAIAGAPLLDQESLGALDFEEDLAAIQRGLASGGGLGQVRALWWRSLPLRAGGPCSLRASRGVSFRGSFPLTLVVHPLVSPPRSQKRPIYELRNPRCRLIFSGQRGFFINING